ncbi:MAG: nucleotidyltransferase family protein [Methanococcaceae archaeon]
MNNRQDNLGNEEKLLLDLCRQEFNEALVSEIRSLTKEIKVWKYFLSLANIHGVEALVCHNFQVLELLDLLPSEVSGTLRNSGLKNLARNEFNMVVTAEAAGMLEKENIPLILLKGMALELTVYGNKGLRQMSDVDILVPPEKCISARRILMDGGFESLPVKSVFHQLILKNVGKHLPSLKKKGALIEIHHELFGDASNGLTRMFLEKSREMELKGNKVQIPDEQLLFLYLVRHLWLHEKNNESQLRLYTDLAVLTGKEHFSVLNSDLTLLAARAEMEEPLASRLMILGKYWKISFPEVIDDFIKKWSDPGFESKFLFFLGSPKGNPPMDKSWYYRHFISEIPGVHRKFIFILGDLFPTIRFMKSRYGCNSGMKAILFYPHRWGKLSFLWKGGPHPPDPLSRDERGKKTIE